MHNKRRYTTMLKMAKTPSKKVLNLGTKIEQKIGAKLNFASGSTVPIEEWIPETKMARTRVIKLRTAEETQQDGIIKLQQFNPSFFLLEKNAIAWSAPGCNETTPRLKASDESQHNKQDLILCLAEENAIPCRAPGCNETTPRLKPSDDSQHIKQDLFLCETHRTKLLDLVSKRCEEEKIVVSAASFKHEDFHGYTCLIGVLEKAFMHLVKKPATLNMPQNSVYRNSNLVFAEVFLNARNFLTITHALLNPDGDNVSVCLPGWFTILQEILSASNPSQLLQSLVTAFRDIVDTILHFFGILYAWVKLDNPGAQVGGGAGLLVTGLGAWYFALSPVVAVTSAIVGLVAGNLLIGGLFGWNQSQPDIDGQNQRIRQYQKFVRQRFRQAEPREQLLDVPANPMGDIEVNAQYVPAG